MKSKNHLSFLCFVFSLTFCTPSSPSGEGPGALLFLLASQSNRTNTIPCPAPNRALPSGIPFADTVTSAPGSDPNLEFKDSNKAVNGVCGGGINGGSTDVYTLSKTGNGASIVLEWNDKKVLNGDGIDFVVYENPFQNQGASTVFVEPLVVEVSINGTNYCGWSPQFTGASNSNNTSVATQVRSDWLGFAGLTPVTYNHVTNPLSLEEIFSSSANDASVLKGGGDGFDLNTLTDTNSPATGGGTIGCDTTLRNSIQTNGFVYLRLTSATARSFPSPLGAFDGGSDIDGVIARNLADR